MIKSLFIFRRDYRIYDNPGLYNCIKNSDQIYCIFIFDPIQIDNKKYKSEKSVFYLCNALKQLNKDLNNKLNIFYGNTQNIIENIIKKLEITDLYYNKDYTPYSVKRDNKINKLNINIHIYEDVLLLPMGTLNKKDDKCYLKYTPFYNNAKLHLKKINKPLNKPKIDKLKKINNLSHLISINKIDKFYNISETKNIKYIDPSKILNNLKKYNDYGENRDQLTYSTTHLSVYLRFGIISVRDVYFHILKISNLKSKKILIQQLLWREFYYYLIYHHPELMYESNIKKYNKIKWKYDEYLYKKWQKGETGIPIVDAGIKELLATGLPHNRARLISCSFIILVGLNWRKALIWFGSKLLDHDKTLNLLNWNWISSTCTFSQPYFRIMNFVSQTKRFDPQCEYIKKYIPKLKDVDPYDIINNPEKVYMKPVIDVEKEKQEFLKRYKNVK